MRLRLPRLLRVCFLVAPIAGTIPACLAQTSQSGPSGRARELGVAVDGITSAIADGIARLRGQLAQDQAEIEGLSNALANLCRAYRGAGGVAVMDGCPAPPPSSPAQDGSGAPAAAALNRPPPPSIKRDPAGPPPLTHGFSPTPPSPAQTPAGADGGTPTQESPGTPGGRD